MEDGSSQGTSHGRLINELTQGKELTRQLETHLGQSPPTELCKSLVQSILSTWDRALAMARTPSDSAGGGPWAGADSPRSLSGSPRSDNSDRGFKDPEGGELGRKRKTFRTWTRRVSFCSGTGPDGPLDDGFSWRKYGQKEILGAKYPRGYYRCTHRNSQGCPATKQVQRSDENPSVFDITYRGKHTCVPRVSSTHQDSPAPETTTAERQRLPPVRDQPPNQVHDSDDSLLLSFSGARTGLTLKTEDLDSANAFPISFFSFSPTPVSSGKAESHSISSSQATAMDAQLTGTFSPPLISPTASGSNYFSTSTCQTSGFVGGPPESSLADVVNAATSAANSPVVELDRMLEDMEFDARFHFDDSFFS